MTALVTSDLHNTDASRDADRFNLFPWLRTQAKKTGAKHVLLLGDLTDAKDRHSSRLVNRLVNEVWELSQLVNVKILKGNHDFVDESSPFFEFMGRMSGGCGVEFITEPTWGEIDDGTAAGGRSHKLSLFLPCTRRWEEEWKSIDLVKGGPRGTEPYRYIFTHMTFDGAVSENGTVLRGVPPAVFANTKAQVVSGDVHKPQRLGRSNITYVGSPYRVHFGDSFTPRILLIKHGEFSDLHFPAKGRELLDVDCFKRVEEADFVMGTQVKVRVRLKRSEYPEWPAMRKAIRDLATERGWDLCGLGLEAIKGRDRAADPEIQLTSHADALLDYASRKKLKRGTTDAGLAFLNEAQK